MNIASVQPKSVYRPAEEPPEYRGLLFQQDPDGTVGILRHSGETDPGSEPDIPPQAVTDRGVFISVDGIGQNWTRHREQIKDWFHGGKDYGVTLPGPVIGIHEGEGRNSLVDVVRIGKNSLLTQAVQRGWLSGESALERAYENDPSVKTIYDQLSQSLRVGRKVTFMAHSGGASQVALALTLFAETQEAGPWVETHVRILGTAPAAHRNDFERAGVAEENIMVTASERDPVHAFYKTDLGGGLLSPLRFLTHGLTGAVKFALRPGPYHQGEYIFAGQGKGAEHKIDLFLRGGKGTDHLLP